MTVAPIAEGLLIARLVHALNAYQFARPSTF
jgi:hypothetical protein